MLQEKTNLFHIHRQITPLSYLKQMPVLSKGNLCHSLHLLDLRLQVITQFCQREQGASVVSQNITAISSSH